MPDSVPAEQPATHGPATNESSSNHRIREFLTAPDTSWTLWSIGLAMVLGDLGTTVYGLNTGLKEQNPFVLAMLSRFGIAGLVALKLFAISWVAIIWLALGRRYGVAAMVGLILPQFVAVVLNVVTILGA